jgi:ribosome-associated protein
LTNFTITGEHIELIRLLKATGLCESGGAAKAAVEQGLVKVDGKVEYRKRCKIRDGRKVFFAGESITVKSIGTR